MKVNELIKAKRIELGFTLKEVADAVGVSESAVSRWESGDISNMRRDRIFSLAKKLGISPVELLGMKPDTTDSKFTELLSTMSDEEREDVMNYIQFVISKRK